MINDVGILKKYGLKNLLPTYKTWSTSKLESTFTQIKGVTQKADRFEGVRVKACDVWDTVAALDKKAGIELQAAVGDAVPPNVNYVIHALALNEQRGQYQPVLWKLKTTPRNILACRSISPQSAASNASGPREARLEQCWFLGVHSDIGGGGTEDSILSNITLAWVISHLAGIVAFEDDSLINIAPSARITAEDRAKLASIQLGVGDGKFRLEMVVQGTQMPEIEYNSSTMAKSMEIVSSSKRVVSEYDLTDDRGDESIIWTNEYVHWTVPALYDQALVKNTVHKWPDLREATQLHFHGDLYVSNLERHLIQAWAFGDLLSIILRKYSRDKTEAPPCKLSASPMLVNAQNWQKVSHSEFFAKLTDIPADATHKLFPPEGAGPYFAETKERVKGLQSTIDTSFRMLKHLFPEYSIEGIAKDLGNPAMLRGRLAGMKDLQIPLSTVHEWPQPMPREFRI